MKMMQRVHHSYVQFRPDPADDGCFLLLGMVIGFQTEKFWAVGMAMRGSLPDKIFSAADMLSQHMLENRSEIVKAQIQAHLNSATRPEDVISAVVMKNFTSFYITQMQSEMVDISVMPSEASMAKIAEEYVLTLFQKQHASVVSRNPADCFTREAEQAVGADCCEAGHAPWMSGPEFWWRPNV